MIGVYVAPDSMLDAGQRTGARRALRIPGRMTWRDSSGTLRFVSVMTRDISDHDVYVECQACCMWGIEASRYLEPLAMVWILHYFQIRSGNHAFKMLRS